MNAIGDTLLKIRNVFYSGSYAFNGDDVPIHEIAFLIDHGYLKLTSLLIADKETFMNRVEEISANPHGYDIAAGGDYSHIALKVLAAEFLERERGQRIRFEQVLCGYTPDVVSEDKLLVAECGHTQNPGKILDYFRLANVRECIQVPYPSTDDNSVFGYSFIASEELGEFLNLLDQKKNSRAKEIIFKRERK